MASPTMQVICLNVVVVPPEEVYMKIFDRMDYNGDGILSIAELVKAVHEIWPDFNSRPAVVGAFKAADLNGNGFIGRNEFELFLYFLSEYSRMWRFFATADTNNDHQLTREEFIRAAPHLDISDAEEIFQEMDPNHSGYIVFDEFCVWMAKKKTKRKLQDAASCRMAPAGAARVLTAALSIKNEQTYITRTIIELKCSIDLLEATASDEQIESWAILIHDCMSTEKRDYHSIQRIFQISDGADPVLMIAAFFHDTVYYYIDQGLSPKIGAIIGDVLDKEHEFLISSNIQPEADPTIAMVLSIFGLVPGQELLPRRGLNKFLSAVLAARLLKDSMPLGTLAKIVVCIQATTAFRTHDNARFSVFGQLSSSIRKMSLGESFSICSFTEILENRCRVMDPLYERLVNTNKAFELGMSERKMIKAIHRAADLSNRSFGIFADDDAAAFLDSIWSILPELNPTLRISRELYVHTLYDYHEGVMNLKRLVSVLDPAELFIAFRGVPGPSEMAIFNRKAKRNLELAKKYTYAKAVTLATVAAFAELTGGNAPFSFFMGDYPSTGHHSDQLGDGLPELSSEVLADCDPVVYDIMVNGRKTDSSFDIKKSLVSAFMYGKLGDAGVSSVMKLTDHPMEKDRAKALLSALPLDVVVPLGKDIAKIAVSRTELVENLLNALREGHEDGTA